MNNNPKRHRDAESGEFVSKEYADEHPSTTVAETVKAKSETDEFLGRLAKDGGVIVSSNNCSTEGIALAQTEGRFYVGEDSLGYVWIPYERTWR